MVNGKVGDDPLIDILTHGRDVYSPLADSLIREISRLADTQTMRDLDMRLLANHSQHGSPDLPRLEGELTDLRDRLRADALERGWEV